MYIKISETIESLNDLTIDSERKKLLQSLSDYIQTKIDNQQVINFNFICTHNSRRSHLSQVWAQALATYYGISNVNCYSGGTEATALFPMAAKALIKSGFKINTIAETKNPIYAIKFSEDTVPVIGFSKTYDYSFNPKQNFIAVLTCSSADKGCPFIAGADLRIALPFEDPKAFDNTPQQEKKYIERSLQIATELKYVFSLLKL